MGGNLELFRDLNYKMDKINNRIDNLLEIEKKYKKIKKLVEMSEEIKVVNRLEVGVKWKQGIWISEEECQELLDIIEKVKVE